MIYISIGSNLGNRLLNIKKALNLLKNYGFTVLRQSIIFETQAILGRVSILQLRLLKSYTFNKSTNNLIMNIQ